MYFDFCVGSRQPEETRLRLDTIFHILGDETYRTPHKAVTPEKIYFVCTVKGAGLIRYDGKEFEIKQGECMFMQPRTGFGYRCKTDTWHFWWFECFRYPAPFVPNEMFCTQPADFKITLFEQSLLYAKEARWDIAESLFEAACGMMHHALAAHGENRYAVLARAAEQYIRENIGSVTVSELCDTLQVKERTLRNLFRTVYGQAPKQVLDKIRLETAQQMLENTMLPISIIAAQLGFSSQFHFSRAFKLAFGVPPMQYRHERSLA